MKKFSLLLMILGIAGCANITIPAETLARAYKQCEANGGLNHVVASEEPRILTAYCLNSASFTFSLSNSSR